MKTATVKAFNASSTWTERELFFAAYRIKDILLRFEIPTNKIRGQCYDGSSTMAGAKGGVATKIQQIEPKAVFTHCFGHALNLSVNDTIKRSSALKDCLDTCFELVKLIKFSPKREAMLSKIKEEIVIR